MDYTVETSPNIGSSSGTDVGDGFYSIPVNGLGYMIEYRWYVNVTDGQYWKHKVYTFQTEHLMVFNPFDHGWLYRKNITIDHTKVAGNLEEFPVLISLTDVDLRDKGQADGDDILFMDGAGIATRVFHEIEYYDGGSGELVAWVNISSLSSVTDTSIMIYYGNQGASNQETTEKTWDSGYHLVQHLHETTGIHYDSSRYMNNGVPNGNLDQNALGRVDGADAFDGNDDYVNMGDASSLKMFDRFSTSAWIYPTGPGSCPVTGGAIVMKEGGYLLARNTDGLIAFALTNDDPGWQYVVTPYFAPLNEWTHVVWSYSAADEELKVVINGGEHIYTLYGAGVIQDVHPSLNEFRIAGRQAEASGNQYFDGKVDEVRLSNIARSDAWVITEYHNQDDPNSFYIIGPEETGP
ncbi:MAG: DUF2341 domain-containing protein [Candidatus Thermoplasmatota archaeon]|nr:DUF2341 domain-containing protein [Candidatus Thermoplasmatota archaeon]MBU1941704.1 DUF2341 domain-containing protein [Candidatus Thermoplasmatota archaeon]